MAYNYSSVQSAHPWEHGMLMDDDRHFDCSECGDEFGNENQLRMVEPADYHLAAKPALTLSQHRQVHLPAKYECFKCTNRYRKYADMIGHIEYGCGGIDAEDLNKSAAMCYQWKKFMDSDYRDDMLGMDAEYGRNWNHEGKPWKCPNCGKWFKKLSSLFTHVWSVYGADGENYGTMGKLKHWLWNRHG